ncbi:CBO0543 family protein [Pelosinus sp. IPA-1]|uniref:CBO0543 family protein n=1 Tax=Pelosinus sp. IPA-1 TaxID=3029569 RepID=UPI00243615FB|nr:CBO0543 family protein [Pelosinus sp. IPA-1]GMB01229.1 hypothetical protein PIPA1_40280 [Pelosinus sp. IPA-1]
MWYILFFRIFLVFGFLLAVWKWGDWKNRENYYSTVLFIMVINLGASFLTYHHILWNYQPDALVKTQTTVELINSYVILPSATFIYLSNFPFNRKGRSNGYIALWILLFSSLELIDNVIGGMSYKNNWSWFCSSILDFAMFPIIRLHYESPLRAWIICLLITIIVLIVFDFSSAEMK